MDAGNTNGGKNLKTCNTDINSLLKNAVIGISITDETGKLTEWNKTLENITGIYSGNVSGKYIWGDLYNIFYMRRKIEKIN
ncbi:MAG: PAS domain S-box protein [Prolixibacteraceae bacterium]|nr:PAS domain S-box protein [Prolixibacteraceae bacterium]MBN2773047.1 PAS domain S-box protein [Prolixibacteraceae bacterium]